MCPLLRLARCPAPVCSTGAQGSQQRPEHAIITGPGGAFALLGKVDNSGCVGSEVKSLPGLIVNCNHCMWQRASIQFRGEFIRCFACLSFWPCLCCFVDFLELCLP